MAKVIFAKNSRRLLGQYCAFGRGFINISAKKKTRPQYIVVGNLWQGRRDYPERLKLHKNRQKSPKNA